MAEHVLTEQLLGMLNYCEAHKFRRVAYKSGVSTAKALKISDQNVSYIKKAKMGEAVPSLALYDVDSGIAFEVGVYKESQTELHTFKLINTDRPMPFHNFISGLAYTFLLDQGFEVLTHSFYAHPEGEDLLEQWGKDDFNYEFFKREQQSQAFWANNIILKKVRPHVPEERCRKCKMQTQCKNFLKFSKLPQDNFFEEFVS